MQLSEFGLRITSVGGITDKKVFAGCAAAGIPIIRIMVSIDLKVGYKVSEEKTKRDIERFLPLCQKYGVKVGIQHHYGAMINNSMESIIFLTVMIRTILKIYGIRPTVCWQGRSLSGDWILYGHTFAWLILIMLFT